MNTRPFFSAPEGDHSGVAITENTLERRPGREARQRKQFTQRARRFHAMILSANRNHFGHGLDGRKTLELCGSGALSAHQTTHTIPR
jgi:hypothetical protein